MGRAAKSNVAFQAQPTTPETATHEGLRLLACLIAEAWRQNGGEVPVADPAMVRSPLMRSSATVNFLM